jgi:hypothetical protein
MEVPAGLEPANGSFANSCVNQLRHGTRLIFFIKFPFKKQIEYTKIRIINYLIMKNMKISSNQIIIVIVAFLIGVMATSLYNQNKAPKQMEDENGGETMMEETMEGEAAAPANSGSSTATAPASTVSGGSSAYAGGTCTPRLSGKKDTSFNAILLNWTPCSNLDEFQFYKLVRSETNPVPNYPGDYVAFSSSNKDAANYIDKTVAPARTYNYRMCVVQRLGKTSCSNTVTVSY